jgi:N-methylhydantoinase A/oxoprolinase/acetone carboxylase beta subunit
MSVNIVSYLVEDVKKSDIKKIIDSSSSLNFKVDQPIVLVGGPVKAYQKDMCKILNADIIVPTYHKVGNAVGALLGDVIYRTESIVRVDKNQYVVFSEKGRTIFDEYEESVNYALDISKKLIGEYMARYGLDMSKIDLDIARNDIKSSYGAKLETKIVAIGIGNPRR